MKFLGFSDVFPNNRKNDSETRVLSEDEAQEELERILEDPANAFLNVIPMNREMIESAASSNEALSIAKRRIQERLTATLNVNKIESGHMERIQVNPESIMNTLESIKRNSSEIGLGADGRVVIDMRDEVSINPEVCYKFSLLETVKRGRNSVAEEAELQSAFYDAAQKLESKDIGVPMPFYEIEVFTTQMIAMEKLHARSVDDITRGLGSLPEWFDVDRFCNSLTKFLDAMHTNNLYHRDLHYGNIMISQRTSWSEGEPMGYVIDFGLSGYAQESMEPYKKEVAGHTFTFDDDYGRIETLRKMLKSLRERQKGNQV